MSVATQCNCIILVSFRMGLVFVVAPEGSVDDTQDGGVALVRAFHYIKSKLNAVKALSFLTDVSHCYFLQIYICETLNNIRYFITSA